MNLIEQGRAAFCDGDFAESERIFTEWKIYLRSWHYGSRNWARLYLASIFGSQNVMGICPAEAEANLRWIERAEAEYREVLDHSPTPEQREIAERGLEAMQIFRATSTWQKD